MILRRFYITENTNGETHLPVASLPLPFPRAQPRSRTHLVAPVPKSKANRVLKTDIPSRSSPKPQS